MELYDLRFSEGIRFHVKDVEDYNIKGTFDPNAASDIEFYGYRETTFQVSGVDSLVRDISYELWVPDNEGTVAEFANYFDDKLTLIVQDAIDKQNGEYNEV